jgi:hypothetical protein
MKNAVAILLGGVTFWCLSASAEAVKPTVDFNRDVRPILSANCFACHGPDSKQRQAGLRLDIAEGAFKALPSGATAIVPGKPKDGTLILRVTTRTMPPPNFGKKLTDAQIATLRRWVEQGARYAPHWAFAPPQRPALPTVKNKWWVANPIDAFVLARLEKAGIKPAPTADRVTLIRRLSLDLLGLPPTPQAVDDFVNDKSKDAYGKLVDRLLASPHYGEKWARHWLDAARYADSNGFNIDAPRQIWKWRDWVIDALNRDLSFDQFATEQIAGDMLPNATTEQKIATGFHRNTLINQEGGIDVEQFRVESVVDRVNTTATVFLGLTFGCAQCHDHKYDPFTQREYYQFYAFLNNCDEPDLEFAPAEDIAQRDALKKQIDERKKELTEYEKTLLPKQAEWEKSLSDAGRKKLKPEAQAALALPAAQRSLEQKAAVLEAFKAQDAGHAQRQAKIAEMEKHLPTFVKTMVMQERSTPRETHVHIQGEFTRKGERVFPAVPSVLHPLSIPNRDGDGADEEESRSATVAARNPNRLDLAKWLVDPKNPLTARVTVNRIWQQYFGRGIVETENDFGTQGAPPTHPELLDWLAVAFVSTGQSVNQAIEQSANQLTNLPVDSYGCGWSLKKLHRLIVTSNTYKQSSRFRPEVNRVDPNNKLLARQSRLRLDGEIVRDVSLAASGLLSRKIGGPSVFPPQPEGIYRFTQGDKNWKTSPGEDRYRRGMYTHFWRSAPYPALIVFDAPNSTVSCTRRNRSNTPLQALTLLNDTVWFEFAQGLAQRVLKEPLPTDPERLRYAFRLCLSRQPSRIETQRLLDLFNQQLAGFKAAPDDAKALLPPNAAPEMDAPQFAAWTMMARVLMNLDEFIMRE